MAGMGEDDFSVRRTGRIGAAAAGGYRLRTTSDDGVRVWVGDRP